MFPDSVLGVILFFAGAEQAMVAKDIGDKKSDFYVMLVVAGFAMWNMGAAFIIGVILDSALKRNWIKTQCLCSISFFADEGGVREGETIARARSAEYFCRDRSTVVWVRSRITIHCLGTEKGFERRKHRETQNSNK